MGKHHWKIQHIAWECSRIDNKKITWGNENVVHTTKNTNRFWHYTINKVYEMATNNVMFIDVNSNLRSCSNLSYYQISW
jgi:hypothetical protein